MKKKIGRPTIMTPETLSKLEEAFGNGASDVEACFIAGIAPDTLYTYQKNNPDFTTRKTALKEMPIYEARKTIVKAIKRGDADVAIKYAERKNKAEFSLRTEISGLSGQPIEITIKEE